MSSYASIFGNIWSGRRSDSALLNLRDPPVVCTSCGKGPVESRRGKSPGHPVLRNSILSADWAIKLLPLLPLPLPLSRSNYVPVREKARGVCVPLEFLACGILPCKLGMAIGMHSVSS